MAEIWRPVPGWEGYYEASSEGRVRSLDREVRFRNSRGTEVRRVLKGRVLKPHKNEGRGGYLSINLSVDGVINHREVHTLVCAAFHGPRPGGMQAAHRDGNPSNCRSDNLRWATPSENALDRVDHGTMQCGERHYAAKLTADAVAGIKASNLSLARLADEYGVAPQTISKVRTGRAWRLAA
ncbi:NUMOD4 motif-containing HNH endonuclease [Sphingomonas elodea]|uniref:NUMOD4 motif-containing HNH endonuclease n=1 Tax=Sphingomonas elodea TaxID=179878 RepID=UPI00026321BB|nr:NUMOD4 motif-containing HNH endonuclease [Sphingomonas elodea]